MRWVQLCGGLNILWHYLSLGLEWKLTFSSPMVTAGFSKFAGILSAALSQHHLRRFEIAPLVLFIVMLCKVHLTSHSRMSGCRWVITPSWLFGSWRYFLYSSSVYSCHLFFFFFNNRLIYIFYILSLYFYVDISYMYKKKFYNSVLFFSLIL